MKGKSLILSSPQGSTTRRSLDASCRTIMAEIVVTEDRQRTTRKDKATAGIPNVTLPLAVN